MGITGDVKAENNIIRSFFLKYNLENTVDKVHDSSEGNVNLKKEIVTNRLETSEDNRIGRDVIY